MTQSFPVLLNASTSEECLRRRSFPAKESTLELLSEESTPTFDLPKLDDVV